MDNYNPEYIDEEERELMESLDEIDASSINKPTEKHQEELRAAAKEYVNKESKMNIRISQYELEKIKERAEQEGLKYQTFVKSILHKYITGQLVDREKKAG